MLTRTFVNRSPTPTTMMPMPPLSVSPAASRVTALPSRPPSTPSALTTALTSTSSPAPPPAAHLPLAALAPVLAPAPDLVTDLALAPAPALPLDLVAPAPAVPARLAPTAALPAVPVPRPRRPTRLLLSRLVAPSACWASWLLSSPSKPCVIPVMMSRI